MTRTIISVYAGVSGQTRLRLPKTMALNHYSDRGKLC